MLISTFISSFTKQFHHLIQEINILTEDIFLKKKKDQHFFSSTLTDGT